MIDIKKNDYIQIKDGSDWHGLVGVCTKATSTEAYIFCVQRPNYTYRVHQGNRDKIVKWGCKNGD
jgi:hypothetical protein